MEEGEGPQHDLFTHFEGWEPGADLLHLFTQVGVGEHDTLRDPCRAPRVLIHGDIVEADLHFGGGGIVPSDAILPLVNILGLLDIGGKLFLFTHQRKEEALGKGQVIANGCIYDLLDPCLRAKIDHPVSQKIQGNEYLGA